MEKETVTLDSIDTYNKLYGLLPQHPLVAVVDLKKATKAVNNLLINYGLYALFLKNDVNCSIKYGRRHYDYQEGTIVSFSPGQTIEVEMAPPVKSPDVIGLLFHPDLIFGTPLADKISSFSFFDYSQMEALHLSPDEKEIFLDCLEKIKREISRPVDHHSAPVLSANIQLLLEYLHRFYDRQFITRHKVNSDVVARFEKELKAYYAAPRVSGDIPTVAHFARLLNLSPGYFGDLIKKETGSSPKDLISLHLVSVAKHRLSVTDDDISEIAYNLGFEYPAHFSRLFKRVTGSTPTRYRQMIERP